MKMFPKSFLFSSALLLTTAICTSQNISSEKNTIKFTENKGQVADAAGNARPDILFSGNTAGADIYLRKGGISYVMSKTDGVTSDAKQEITNSPSGIGDKRGAQSVQRVDMDFIGSNTGALIKTENQTEGYKNYYLAHCPAGITNVRSFNQITYEELYPDIDVCFLGGGEDGMQYDFIVKPGGNPGDIRLRYSGTDKLEIINGKLKITTRIGEIKEWMPSVYQNINGKKINIHAEYVLTGTTLSFKLTSFNSKYPLIIDPWSTWITYLGGNGFDHGYGLATDAVGNVLVTGYTTSTSFPVLAGFQVSAGGGDDAYVVKFDGAGSLLWSTYYGGSALEEGLAIATDASGNVFVTGYTVSTNLPVLNGFQMTNSGSYDAFVLKCNGAGALQWATYYGGSTLDEGTGIATDANGDVYLTGLEASTNFPVSAGAFQMTNAGGYDSYLVKFSGAGARLWATYYGGSSAEEGRGIACDASGNIFITGVTPSTNFPVLGGFQMSNAGVYDAYIVKFSGAGVRLWGTYCGGSGNDWGWDVACDAGGNVFLTGQTNSVNFPVLAGFQMAFGGGINDSFVAKLSGSGALQWATYYGGNANEEGYGIATDAAGNCYITGDVYSPNFPVTGAACQPAHGGGSEDNYLASFDGAGNRLCATYIGGTGHDEEGSGGNIAVYGCYVYITGNSPGSYPVTAGSYQTTIGGGNDDAFIAQLPKDCSCNCNSPAITTTSASTNPVCFGQCTGTATTTPTGGTAPYTYSWNSNPVQTTQLATGLCAGNYSVLITDGSGITATATVNITQPSQISATLTATSTFCNSLCAGSASAIINGGTPAYSYSWNTVPAQTTSTATALCAGNYSLTIIDQNGCAQGVTVAVTQSGGPTVTVTTTPQTCAQGGTATAAAAGTPPYTYLWSNGATTSQVSNLATQTYTVTVTDASGCSQSATAIVTSSGGPTATAATNVVITAGTSTTLTAGGGGTYLWSNGETDALITVSPAVTTVYCVTVTDINNCSDTDCVTVTVIPEPTNCSNAELPNAFVVPNAFSPNEDGQNDRFTILYSQSLIDCVKEVYIVVYNRWGEKVFESGTINFSWDGTFRNKPEDPAVFAWYMKIVLNTGKELKRKGNISLLR